MLSRNQFRLLTVLGLVGLTLMAANVLLSLQNRESQQDLAQRQQFIQQTVPLESLYREMVKSLAGMGVNGNDRVLVDMLTAQGLNVTVQPPVRPASAPVSTTPPAKKK